MRPRPPTVGRQKVGPDRDMPVLDRGQPLIDVAAPLVRLSCRQRAIQVGRIRFVGEMMLELDERSPAGNAGGTPLWRLAHGLNIAAPDTSRFLQATLPPGAVSDE